MKLIVAIVRPDRVNDILESLYRAEVKGITISKAKGHGGEVEYVTNYRGTSAKLDFTEKARLEIAVSDSFVDITVNAIIEGGKTGEVGDGKIIVQPIENIYRIRTGETDEAAVTPV